MRCRSVPSSACNADSIHCYGQCIMSMSLLVTCELNARNRHHCSKTQTLCHVHIRILLHPAMHKLYVQHKILGISEHPSASQNTCCSAKASKYSFSCENQYGLLVVKVVLVYFRFMQSPRQPLIKYSTWWTGSMLITPTVSQALCTASPGRTPSR